MCQERELVLKEINQPEPALIILVLEQRLAGYFKLNFPCQEQIFQTLKLQFSGSEKRSEVLLTQF